MRPYSNAISCVLSLFLIKAALGTPASLPQHLSIHSRQVEDVWQFRPVGDSVAYFDPVQPAADHLIGLYSNAILDARQRTSFDSKAVAYRFGGLGLVIRVDEPDDGRVVWQIVIDFCQEMLEKTRRGHPIMYRGTLTNERFPGWSIWMGLKILSRENGRHIPPRSIGGS